MTTKEQERKALEQIRKIVEGLGENSYIGMAFEGCFEIARDNIENDWGCSMKERAKAAERNAEKLDKELAEMKAACSTVNNRYEAQKETTNELRDQIVDLKSKLAEAEARIIAERKDISIVVDGKEHRTAIKSFRYINNEGFKFVNVEEPNGWMTSYRLDNIQALTIE